MIRRRLRCSDGRPRISGALVAGAFMALVLVGCGDNGPIAAAPSPTTTTAVTTSTAPSASSTTTPPDPAYLNRVAISLGALPSVQIHDGPAGAVTQQIANPNEHGVPTVFLVKTHDVPDATGALWHEVYLPVKPNGSTGWVAAADVELQTNTVRLGVHRRDHQLTYTKDGVLVATYPIAVGKTGTETPIGLYFIKELLQPNDPGGSYGPYAYGLSGFASSVDLGAQFGDGVIGIHGTNEPSKVGTDVSHGCIRLRNVDITALVDAQLPLGTPVDILD